MHEGIYKLTIRRSSFPNFIPQEQLFTIACTILLSGARNYFYMQIALSPSPSPSLSPSPPPPPPPPPPLSSDTGPTSSWLYVQSDEPHGSTCGWQDDPRAEEDYGADEQILVCSYSSGASFYLGGSEDKGGIVLPSVDTFR